ncbi:MAG TPA: hypothetical protein VL099_10805 [Candidatus Binatia bacterium]|nr:hypothetical protein [Candidatus Binatia bacterium]
MADENIIALACLLLAAAVALFIFFVRQEPGDSAPFRTRLDQLMERRDAIFDNLRDLRFEFRSGKFSEGDYEQVRQSLEAEAASVLAEMDALTGAGSLRPRPRPGSATSGGEVKGA